MIGTTRRGAPRMARRAPYSQARRTRGVGRAFRRGLARYGFHGIVIVVGLAVTTSVWNNPRLTARVQPSADPGAVAEAVVEPVLDVKLDLPRAAAVPTAEPMRPLVRRVTEGDTINGIAAEYSVSISTILASNRLENPDLIMPGQELLIPPIEGVVAEIEPGETLAQLAERLGADVNEIAQANGLPSDPDLTIPYERLIVPGLESAVRAASSPRQPRMVAASARAEIEPSSLVKPTLMTYEVQEGDTIAQLSAQFGVSIWTILTANNIVDPSAITPGMQLKVLPVNGIEHEVQPGESLMDIAMYYEVDLGPLVDFNALDDADSLTVGAKLTIPGAEKSQPTFSLASFGAPAVAAAPVVPAPSVPAVASQPRASQPAAATAPAASTAQRPAAPKPPAPAQAARPQPAGQASAPNRVTAAAVAAPRPITGGGAAGAVVATAMKYLGSRYVFGGTSPSGFDCSGFVWYVHQAVGKPVSRGLWGQLNGGPRIPSNQLQPGDAVFFANTYMPGLSHVGIYIGGGRFIHASDESSGVKISSLNDSYWGPRYVGASRLN